MPANTGQVPNGVGIGGVGGKTSRLRQVGVKSGMYNGGRKCLHSLGSTKDKKLICMRRKVEEDLPCGFVHPAWYPRVFFLRPLGLGCASALGSSSLAGQEGARSLSHRGPALAGGREMRPQAPRAG